MIVMGCDPGGTTGFCVCRYVNEGQTFTLLPLHYEQVEHGFHILDKVSYLLARWKPDVVVQESVVTTGQLNKDKIAQVQAHDRIQVICRARDIIMREVTPQAVKKVKFVPKDIEGTHARDAYRVIVANFRALGQYESDFVPEKEKGRDTRETSA